MLALAFTISLGGCDDPNAVPAGPSLRIVNGSTVSDTVAATPSQALVAEVRVEDGQVKSGIAVRFEALQPDTTLPRGTSGSVYVQAISAQTPCSPTATTAQCPPVVVASTDETGRAAVLVRLGSRAGPARVLVSVPTLGVRDTATFTVAPGAAFRIVVSPRDTALRVGAAAQLRASVVDRYGNPRSEQATLDGTTAGVSADANLRVTAQSLGRSSIRVRAQSLVDTASVSVVPAGRLVLVTPPILFPISADTQAIIVMNTDGSSRRVLPRSDLRPANFPDWSPSRTQIVASAGISGIGGPGLRMWITDTLGSARVLVSARPDSLNSEYVAQFTADGQWIYFDGSLYSEFGRRALWRARPDGSGFGFVYRPSGSGEVPSAEHPSPSPDGTRVLYVRRTSGNARLHLYDLATGADQALGVSGTYGRWSPDGSWIVYNGSITGSSGELKLVRPDGTGARSLGSRVYDGPADWSPDGAWVVARASGGGVAEIVGVTTSMVLPLAFTSGLQHPAWSP